MSETQSNSAPKFSRSVHKDANDAHQSCALRTRSPETAHHERLFYRDKRNKRLSWQKPFIMSSFPARRPKIGFVSHPTRILDRFLMFSIRWALFRTFLFHARSFALICGQMIFQRMLVNGFALKNAVPTNWARNPNSVKLN
jgi:hypothetical protein